MKENSIEQKFAPRVLMILRNYVSIPNGTQFQAVSLAKQLVRRGCRVEFVIGNTGGLNKEKPEIAPGIPAHILPSPPIRGAGTFFYLLTLARFLLKNKNNYDIFHVFFAKYSAFVAGILKSFHKKPILCKPACSGANGDIAALRGSVRFKGLMKKGLFKVDRFISVSSSIKDEFVEEGFDGGKITLLPNGVDTERFMKHPEDQRKSGEKIRLLFAGRLSEQKGIYYLLDAVKMIKDKFNFHLSIVGEGPLRDELLKYTKDNALESTVTFEGPRLDIEKFYSSHDIFVLPSVSEGLSNSLLEAMSSGMAVVSTEVSGSVDIIKNGTNGLLVKCMDSAALADAISKLLANPVLISGMGKNAKQTIDDTYSFKIVAEKYMQIYKELLSRKK